MPNFAILNLGIYPNECIREAPPGQQQKTGPIIRQFLGAVQDVR